ncbi:DNA segregation ATPase FtsK/SpoIIIE [Longilinea arvoryzae]|uniref:DNA segregation ATPase FtsK/SpoIIIE n=1 Tax=Longilinea arvoryzae TaxID=360412 RepID=A0A0S7BNY5_9CHLR|nr:DNA translocase FtsK [Longilinea arvoryzae]GAP15498.1 DNA segregation ATPase FtsK/SpoIIIE [Longilinea arvoryzae]
MAKTPARPSKPAPARKTTKTSAPLRKSARGSEKRSTPQRSGSHARKSIPPRPSAWSQLSPERKLDVLGVILALLGLLSLLSLVSGSNGVVTGWWVNFLRRAAGWGAFILPLALLGIGMWLVLRNIDRLPLLSAERLTGIVLLLLNLLAWMHLFGGGGWELAAAGKGGGYIGGFFQGLLVDGLGSVGAVIVLVAWMLLALVFTFDISVNDLTHFLSPILAWLRGSEKPTPLRSAADHAPVHNLEPEPHEVSELPPDFSPMPGRPEPAVRKAALRPAQAGKPAQAVPPASSTAASALAAVTSTSAGEIGADAPAPVNPWTAPSVEAILDPATPVAVQGNVDHDRGRLIEETLASFGTPAHIVEISRGPTVTQFGVEPDFIETRTGRMRVRVSKIVSLADDLALALAAQRIRIQAPVPGRSYVGIEVPNTEISRVALREVMESEAYRKIKSPLRFALGKDVAGKSVAADLAAMPHLLIAGTTGSGKSVCVNAILSALLLNNTPAELRLVLVDPKRVELTGYNGVPHLLAPVVTDAEKVANALQWMQREMDARYHRFSQTGARNISDYNSKHADKLPYLVAVIDELADLMMLAPEETERSITRLAQLARATGIHLIIATQRPSVDVVTGLIKANFPARVAFAVASGVDSRVILDQPGAERLLGRGDMLFQAPDAAAPVRLQGVYVSDAEIQRLVDTWRVEAMNVKTPAPTMGEVDALPVGAPLHQASLFDEGDSASEGDVLLPEAIDLVRREGRASITMLQRRMRIGYTRAARLIDAMEEKGIISPALPNSQTREVLDYGPTAPPEET